MLSAKDDALVLTDNIGPVQARRCTDLIFLLLFLATFVCMNGIGFAATGIISSNYISEGDPVRLIRGVDYTGAVCGYDVAVKFLPQKWEPNALGFTPNDEGVLVPTGLGICVSTCPATGEVRTDPYGTYGSWTATISTVNVLGYCIPVDSTRVDNFLESSFGDFLRASRIIVVLGFGAAIGFSLLFMATIRVPGVLRTVVWLAIVLTGCIFIGGGYLVLSKISSQQDQPGPIALSRQQIRLEKAAGACLVICGVVWVSVICVLRERVALAITLVRESVKALIAMPFLIFFPLFECIVFGLFTALWAVYSLYLVSSGNLTTEVDDISGDSYKVLSYNDNATVAIVFLLFVWVWNTAFVEALGQLLTSHAVLTWYFAPNRKQVSNMQVIQSAATCARYHGGTAAFGSLLIALLQYLRLCLDYLRSRLQGRTSRLARCCLCSLSCLLCCFEKCLQFVCDAAYVQCAMHGTAFCTSAVRGVSLIARNLGRVSTVTAVAVFVVFVGKLSIALTTALVAYLYFASYMSDQLSGPVMASVLVGYIAYQTSSLFLNVVSATANTILQAFLIEEELGGGEAQARRKDVEMAVEAKEPTSSEADMQAFIAELKESTMEVNESNWNVLYDQRGVEVEMVVNFSSAMEIASGQSSPARAPASSSAASSISTSAVQLPSTSNNSSSQRSSTNKPHKPSRQVSAPAASKTINRPAFDTSTATPLPRRSWVWDSDQPQSEHVFDGVVAGARSKPTTSVDIPQKSKSKQQKREFGWK